MAAVTDVADRTLEKLAVFGRSVETSSLYVLLTIDSNTIDSLQEVDQIARALALSCDSTHKDISTSAALAGHLLDPTQKIISALSAGYGRIDTLLAGLTAQRTDFARQGESGDDHCRLLSFALERCVESFTLLIDSARKLEQAIVTHDESVRAGPTQNLDSPDDSVQSDAA